MRYSYEVQRGRDHLRVEEELGNYQTIFFVMMIIGAILKGLFLYSIISGGEYIPEFVLFWVILPLGLLFILGAGVGLLLEVRLRRHIVQSLWEKGEISDEYWADNH